jgi:hypothetical protein
MSDSDELVVCEDNGFLAKYEELSTGGIDAEC